MADKTEKMTPEQLREFRNANLARGREKALAKRKEIIDLKRKEKEMLLEERKKKIDERMMKVKQYEEESKPKEVVEQPTQPKKNKKQIKIELSDSSDDDKSSSESDSDESVEFVVQRKPRKVAVKKVKKKAIAHHESIPHHVQQPSVQKLSGEVAKQMLQKKLMDDAQAMAFRSLFPYHNL